MKNDDLLKKICSGGCDFKLLKEISFVTIGEFVHKDKQNENDPYPVYNGGTTNTGFYNKYNRDKNQIIISARGANAGFVNRVFNKFWSGNSCYTISIFDENVDWNYLYFFLKNNEDKIMKLKTEAGIPAISKQQIERLEIPVPPLEVQREIVRILDSFTFLSAELSAELQARKKQYEYYRDQLLVPSKVEINNCVLSDIATIKNGKDYKHLSEGGYPVYGSGGVMKYVDQYVYDKPSVLIPRKGSLSNLFYLDEPFWNVDTVFYTEINENKVVPKYLYYLLKKEHLENLNKAGGVPSLTQTILNNVRLSIPSLDVQRRIVNCLDNFESICNDLNIGLPAEIEARQKQYEYYRDMLLTFAETGDIMPQTDRQTDRQTSNN